MAYQIGVRHLGLAILAVATVGCASPCAYHGDNGSRPFAISGRHAGCDCAETGDVELGDIETGDIETGNCGAESCGGTCGTGGPCRLRDMLTCRTGCGRMYWGEWAYDPPDECDPCNNHGDWVGPQGCPPSGWLNLWNGFHGSRFHTACGSPTCTDCAAPTNTCRGTEVSSDDSPDDVWVDQSTDSFESMSPQSSSYDLPPESVRIDARKTTPGRHPTSRLVQRTQTPVVH
jgi:hypothetical protein